MLNAKETVISSAWDTSGRASGLGYIWEGQWPGIHLVGPVAWDTSGRASGLGYIWEGQWPWIYRFLLVMRQALTIH